MGHVTRAFPPRRIFDLPTISFAALSGEAIRTVRNSYQYEAKRKRGQQCPRYSLDFVRVSPRYVGTPLTGVSSPKSSARERPGRRQFDVLLPATWTADLQYPKRIACDQ